MITETLYYGAISSLHVYYRSEDGSIVEDIWDDIVKIVLVGYTLVLYHNSSTVPTIYAPGIWTFAS